MAVLLTETEATFSLRAFECATTADAAKWAARVRYSDHCDMRATIRTPGLLVFAQALSLLPKA
ncbi:hypothetical protein CU048_11600 [Beijerinckiaceae bacterium]|nr:hypothetical protein CU048_11600 [Beijerinckiaceae bacterium]